MAQVIDCRLRQNNPPPSPVAASSEPESSGAAKKDASSGTVISIASIGSVGLVVLVCGCCFFLGRRRKSPGFHMPLSSSTSRASSQPDPPRKKTTSTHKDHEADRSNACNGDDCSAGCILLSSSTGLGSLDAATGDGGGVVLAEATVDNLGHTELVPCLSIGRAVLLTR